MEPERQQQAEQRQSDGSADQMELSPDRHHQQSNIELLPDTYDQSPSSQQSQKQNGQEAYAQEQKQDYPTVQHHQAEHVSLMSKPNNNPPSQRPLAKVHENPPIQYQDLNEQPQVRHNEHQQSSPMTNQVKHKTPLLTTDMKSSMPVNRHQPVSSQQHSHQLSKLDSYLTRNDQTMKNIMASEFGGTEEHETNSIAVDSDVLFPLLVHLLSIEPIEITSSGDNILYSPAYGEPMITDLFGLFRQENDIALEFPLTYEELCAFLRYMVQNEHLEVEYMIPNQSKRIQPTNIPIYTSNGVQHNLNSESINLRSELISTKKRYQQLLAAKQMTENERKLIHDMIGNIDMQLNDMIPKIPLKKHLKYSSEQPQDITSSTHQPFSTESALEVIFDFYCKQSYATGKNATFDRIKHESNILTMNKFMVFCRDFNIIAGTHKIEQSETSIVLPRMPDLVEIFKKNSTNYKEMNVQQFQEALRKIAQRIFGGQQATEKMHGYLGVDFENNFREIVKKHQIPYVFKDVRKSKPASYKIHSTGQAIKLSSDQKVGSARSVGKHTADSELPRNSIERLERENDGSTQNLMMAPDLKHIKLNQMRKNDQHLSKPPLLPLPKKNRTTIQVKVNKPNVNIKLSNKALVHHLENTPTQPPSNGSNRQISLSNITGYSQIYASKKRGLAVPSSAEDKKQFKLNSIVSDARLLMSQATHHVREHVNSISNNAPQHLSRQQPHYNDNPLKDQKASLGNLLADDDGEQDQYLNKHWQMEKNLSHNDLNLRINEKLQQIRQQEIGKERSNSTNNSLYLLASSKREKQKVGSSYSRNN